MKREGKRLLRGTEIRGRYGGSWEGERGGRFQRRKKEIVKIGEHIAAPRLGVLTIVGGQQRKRGNRHCVSSVFQG